MVFPLITEDTYMSVLEKYGYYFEELRRLCVASGEPLEGNCFYQHLTCDAPDLRLLSKQMNLYSAATSVHSILEIGFNAGHSCLLFLLANPDSKILCFDLGIHTYVHPCFDYLDRLFPDRLTLILGNSLETVPAYVAQHRDVQFDLVHVDGGHERAVAAGDFQNTYPMLKKGGVMIWDDTQDPALNELCEDYIRQGLVSEIKTVYDTVMYQHRFLKK
jgi:predicted O-methyltransferase YrrM